MLVFDCFHFHKVAFVELGATVLCLRLESFVGSHSWLSDTASSECRSCSQNRNKSNTIVDPTSGRKLAGELSYVHSLYKVL